MTNPENLHKKQNSAVIGKVISFDEWERRLKEERELVLGLRLLLECMSILAAAQAIRAQAAASQFTPLIETGKNNIKIATKKLETFKTGGDPNSLAGFPHGPLDNHPQKDELTERAGKLATAYMELYPERAYDAPLNKSEALELMDRVTKMLVE